jgi:signal transduction histidine kinase
MHDLRQIIEEAKPTVLQLFGVAEAIENHLDRSARESGLSIRWQVSDDSNGMLAGLDQTVSISLFRIVQEAVNNAIRHGQPETVLVRILRAEQGLLSIEVIDDGCGIPPTPAPGGDRSHGIDNMKTRARLISARLEIGRGASGIGTVVRLSLPLTPATRVEA